MFDNFYLNRSAEELTIGRPEAQQGSGPASDSKCSNSVVLKTCVEEKIAEAKRECILTTRFT